MIAQRVLLAVVGVLFWDQGLSADVISASATIDLNKAITAGTWTGFAHPLERTVRVRPGDTVIINLGFKPGQVLNWDGSQFFAPWLMLDGYPQNVNLDQSGMFSYSDLSVELLGLTQGVQIPPSQLNDSSSGAIHLGPNPLGGDGVTRNFTGAIISFVADWEEDQPYRDYSTIGYETTKLFGGAVSNPNSTAVPEPSAFALAALGCAALAATWHTRRRVRHPNGIER